jgi:hypothetical protein
MDFSALPNDVLIKILRHRRDIKRHDREIKETKEKQEQLIKVLDFMFDQYEEEELDEQILKDYVFDDDIIETPFHEVICAEAYRIEKEFYECY